MRSTHYLALLSLCCLWAYSTLSLADARAYFDRETIYQGETVILTIEIDYPANGHSPDLGELTHDFSIIETRRGGGRREVNGNTVTLERWVVHLEPRSSGLITVPALRVGPESTRPVNLEVLPLPGAITPSPEDIFLEVEISPRAPYVQSQVRYTQRLLYALPLQEGELTNEGIEGAMLERLGEDLSYVDARNGKLYRITERHYVLFPQRSGQLTIPATRFNGRVAVTDSNSQFGAIQRGRPISLSSEPITLTVRPQPDRFSGDIWLPTEDLVLNEQWADDPPQFRVGEPVVRTLVIEAAGLDGAQLPELQPELPTDFNRYLGQPEITTNNDGIGIRGRREQQMVIQPTQAGRYTLPEIRLAWWDIRQDREQVAVLPAREIEVLAAASLPLPPQAAEPVRALVEESTVMWSQNPWFWSSMALLIMWLATVLLWWRGTTSSHVPPQPTTEPDHTSLNSARRALQRACQDHDPLAASRALLAWAALRWPNSPPRNLATLAGRLQHGGEAVLALEQALYASATQAWQGDTLWQALRGGLVASSAEISQSRRRELPELYPERV